MKILISLTAISILSIALAISSSAQTTLTALDGSKVNIEGQNGKVVIMAIGAKWLPLSVKQAEFTNALAKKYAGKDVVVYFIATDSTNSRSKNYASDDQIKEFAATNKLTVSVLRDADGLLTQKKFNIEQFPSFVVLDKRGQKYGDAFGGLDPKFDVTIPISKTVDKLM